VDYVVGAEDVCLDELGRVELALGHDFQRRGVDDGVDAMHCHFETRAVADVADNNALDIRIIEQPGDRRSAETTSPASYQNSSNGSPQTLQLTSNVSS
jgi:hypothetical protein